MASIFAVYYTPSEGPDAMFLVRAASPAAAKEKVLAKMHESDMTNVTIDELTHAANLGDPDELFVSGVHIDGML